MLLHTHQVPAALHRQQLQPRAATASTSSLHARVQQCCHHPQQHAAWEGMRPLAALQARHMRSVACAAKRGWEEIWDMPAPSTQSPGESLMGGPGGSTAPADTSVAMFRHSPAPGTTQEAPQAQAVQQYTDEEDDEEQEEEKEEEEDSAAGPRDASKGIYDARFFKLVPLAGGEATLEIDGVKMHITATKLPTQDARDKVKLARVRKNSVVLDVCTGLGYSAIACARAGAAEVVTLELQPTVLEAARQNPMSQDLFTLPQIKQLQGDALELIKQMPDEYFSSALHDPPRFSHAGHLYSQEFYSQLARVMRSGARLFHYTGSPNKNGKDMRGGIRERLQRAGFTGVRWVDECQGFAAMKA